MRMRSTLGLFTNAVSLAIAGWLTSAAALPLSGSAAPALVTPEAPVELAHGCHRGIQRDYAGWHFHTRGCLRQPTAPPGLRDGGAARRYHRGPSCRYQCRHVGPVKTCEQVCR